ncbi:MAG TPA: YtxH domain-containing protein, partial [Ktedonobacter sp.]|nr:YtxH domain-containing protein [Ktedonobacter sp.]
MGRFFNGMLVGAGIALLVAPMRGDEMRQYLRERWE